jgi:RNA polymerase sigma factor (sigma-70 family)
MRITVDDETRAAPPWCLWREELTGWLLKRLGRHAVAEDLAQESLVRLWQALERGEAIRNRRAWLYRVAGNLAVDHARRRLPLLANAEGTMGALEDPRCEGDETCVLACTAEGDFDRAELLAELPQAWKELPPEDQMVLWARYREDLDPRAMAVREGHRVSTIKGRLYRARRRLRERLLQQATARRQGRCRA